MAPRLFGPLPSVALEQLVDEREVVLLSDGVKRWQGVALVLQNGHLGPVQVRSVGDARHPCVAGGLSLEPRCEDLEELWDQVFFLKRHRRKSEQTSLTDGHSAQLTVKADPHRQPKRGHFHRLLIGVSPFSVIDQLRETHTSG